ncbi:unnamed protein product [Vitrella brassicaformis CCMP3155]|uniref:40S ribosomal protein S24 n=2 Tax=Vitrella brassicaformis TaxID=1169539 RepID=A0A0G4G9U9_VITBC|nr:unnamed protein product [Vitrella brassicaformis CCMP3155]|eukprot:CEM25518.1 unnamed protein product [Vitrella brassicaformis CCMP3155]
MDNPLLQRKQFCVDVIHPNRPNVSKNDLRERIAKDSKLNIKDPQCVILFGFKTAFGGGRSTGFGLIYNNIAAVKKYEQKYRLVRFGIEPKVERGGRRAKKELKNRKKKVRGKEKSKVTGGKKKK